MAEDERLAIQAAAGDLAAFSLLVQHMQGRVRGFLLRLTAGDHALADDLAQDTFLLAQRKLGQFRGDGAFIGWLLRIAWTCFLTHRRAMRPAVVIDSEESSPAPDPAMKLDLERALYRLGENERAALTLCYGLGFSHGEAAAMMGLPLGTLKSYVQRGRERLRALLSE